MDHAHDKDTPGFVGRTVDIAGVVMIAICVIKAAKGWKTFTQGVKESLAEKAEHDKNLKK